MDEGSKKVLKSTWLWVKYVMLPSAVIYVSYGQLLFEWIGNNWYVLLVFLAAICNAVMSSIDNIPHFTQSVFSRLNKDYWSKEDSWNTKYKIGGYKFDGWHNFQSGMICSFIGSLWIALSTGVQFTWVDFLLVGYLYNIIFSLFYDIIFRRNGKN